MCDTNIRIHANDTNNSPQFVDRLYYIRIIRFYSHIIRILFGFQREAVARERHRDFLNRLLTDAVQLFERTHSLAREPRRALDADILQSRSNASREFKICNLYL